MITIVDYNAGNLRSVKRACDAVGIDSVLSNDPDVIARADKLIFPGVGAAQSAMETLNTSGLSGALSSALVRGTPILGICLGAQIILDRSEEGNTPTLGLIAGVTRRFQLEALAATPASAQTRLKIPHMGWNQVQVAQAHPLLTGLLPGDEFYFVHSYFPSPTAEGHVYATTDYGPRFACAIGRDNLFATQFHPEKSGRLGLEMLARFSTWDGSAC